MGRTQWQQKLKVGGNVLTVPLSTGSKCKQDPARQDSDVTIATLCVSDEKSRFPQPKKAALFTTIRLSCRCAASLMNENIVYTGAMAGEGRS